MIPEQVTFIHSRGWIWRTTAGLVAGFAAYSVLTPLVIRLPIEPLLVPEILGILALGQGFAVPAQ
jgi:hypothetical protein